ncbi:uncharacterized protein A1O5_09471 [Cladophialophora psammophila CBS 110553]|uniref:Transcription factor domain-containing protein n=1 Tax=Cladophialophora psammophila CBS 110553 TaxID=1182543 RepID=W9WHT5_9EURO|nr:uncharacterized protein A1O5_09471 [Cladophialophora psammophila CBS 110553]EXJ67458.1 hypothetical protein A1O5_09471 [Cladophialophora psammophila CBS 110553]
MARAAESRKKRPKSWNLAVRLPRVDVDVAAVEDNVETSVHPSQDDPQCYRHVPHSLHPYALFPVEPDGRARELIHFMHNEGEYLYRPFRNEWFAMAVIDCTAFYLSLANAALFFHQMAQRKGCEHSDFEESSAYLSLCLNQVTERLGKESDHVSDGVITTILGFLCHDSSVGRWDRFDVHMKGLKDILRLRGGFQALNRTVVMFTSWFDIVRASVLDCRPRFLLPADVFAPIVQHDISSPSMQDLIVRIRHFSDELAETAIALERTAQLATFVNNNAQNPLFWKDGATAAKRITPVLHFLLSLRRPTDSGSCSNYSTELMLSEVVRLALLILVASVKQAFSLIADELTILQQRFSALLYTAPYDTHFPELSLWAIIMVASVRSNESNQLHASAVVKLMRGMGIRSGRTAVDIAKCLIWIDECMETNVARFIFDIDRASCSFETGYRD